jgi:hypothetical protein
VIGAVRDRADGALAPRLVMARRVCGAEDHEKGGCERYNDPQDAPFGALGDIVVVDNRPHRRMLSYPARTESVFQRLPTGT